MGVTIYQLKKTDESVELSPSTSPDPIPQSINQPIPQSISSPSFPRHNSFIKTENNVMLNPDYIRLIKKIDDCMLICNQDKCFHSDVRKVCKIDDLFTYNKLNSMYFQNGENK